MDNAIKARAKLHQGTPEQFDNTLNQLVNEKFGTNRDLPYPTQGWMEYHRFPDSARGLWIEVWKKPWWENYTKDGVSKWRAKGILVFFEDKDKTYLRRSVVWRWLSNHIRLANEANARLLRSRLPFRRPEPLDEELCDYRLSQLLRRALVTFRAFVEEKDNPIVLSSEVRNSDDLKMLLYLVESCYKRNMPAFAIQLTLPNPSITFRHHGDDLLAILVVLAINATEATLLHPAIGDKPHPVEVLVRLENRHTLFATVTDQAIGFTADKARMINNFELLHEVDGAPGGGFFLAKRLALHIQGKHTMNGECLVIKPNPSGRGAVVTLRLPLVALA
jgi:signal transduction histidine kinase